MECMINPEISILLATLRPEKAKKCINKIAETSEGVNYEIVVVSSLDMPSLLAECKGYSRIKFVKEEKKEGCNKAFTTGYENASGKYVFAIADDHRLGQNCLRNLIEFMQPHDNEIFLAGARCCGVYGAAPECKAYGFYYAFNPCIRRDLVAQVGGFYDPYYKSYYGDPDLSMRVWHNGGKVELCPDAWVEFHNEFDDIDFESHEDYAERDFNAFFARWHPIYGHLANSSKESDINKGNNFAFPGIPPEKCTRLIVFLRKRDWSALKKELENAICLDRDNLSYVLEDMLRHLAWIFIPAEIQQELSKWLIKQLLAQTSFEDTELTAIFEARESHGINCITEASNVGLANIAMFFLVNGALKRDPEIIIENYNGVSIIYSSRKYYAWHCSFGGFSIREFKAREDKFAFCESKIYQVIMKIDELMANNPSSDWQKIQDIEDFFTSCKFEMPANEADYRSIFEKLPDEICVKLMFYLRFKDWAGIEQIINNPNQSAFIIRKYISFVYDEILRNMSRVPSNIVLMLSKWLWENLYESSICAQNITEEQDHTGIRLVVPGYRNYNIIYCKGQYYGWPCLVAAGGFSIAGYINGIAPTAVAGESPMAVKELIDRASPSINEEEENKLDWIAIQQNEAIITHYEVKDLDNDIRTVVPEYRQHNIVYCKGLYYGWPCSAGRFSLMRYMNGFERTAVAGKSIIEVKNLIDAKLIV